MEKDLLVVSNWKMSLNFNEEINFASSCYDDFINLSEQTNHKLVLCPSFLSLYTLAQMFKSTKIELGAQNCSSYERGAFTGQISAESLNFILCNYCIIGHSESRKYKKESEDDIAKKFIELVNNKVSPILCIGESLEEYRNKNVFNVLEKQLEKILNIIDGDILISPYTYLNIAYEPVWAIGSSKTPDFDHLETVFAWIYSKISKLRKNLKFRILYGGSVNGDIAKKFRKIEHLGGFLIGRSSLDFQELKKIVSS